MYAFRTTLSPTRNASQGDVELAFTDRHGGVSAAPFNWLNLALSGDDPIEARAENHHLVLADFAPHDELCDLHQVHGSVVDVAEETVLNEGDRPRADAVVAGTTGVTLMVRAADCVPVLLADPDAGVIGAAHCGRSGLVAGIVSNTVATMRDRGAAELTAWIGPHVCGGCYEVPADLQAEVVAAVPESVATTTWGTPALDLGAGVRAQLERDGVTVLDVSTCTRESPDLFSYRRDGAAAGRQAGLIRLRRPERA